MPNPLLHIASSSVNAFRSNSPFASAIKVGHEVFSLDGKDRFTDSIPLQLPNLFLQISPVDDRPSSDW